MFRLLDSVFVSQIDKVSRVHDRFQSCQSHSLSHCQLALSCDTVTVALSDRHLDPATALRSARLETSGGKNQLKLLHFNMQHRQQCKSSSFNGRGKWAN